MTYRGVNALAESVIGLYKTAVINRRGPWRTVEAVELATLDWVDWFNNSRLLAPLAYVPPVEREERYYRSQEAPVMTAGVTYFSLWKTRYGSPKHWGAVTGFCGWLTNLRDGRRSQCSGGWRRRSAATKAAPSRPRM